MVITRADNHAKPAANAVRVPNDGFVSTVIRRAAAALRRRRAFTLVELLILIVAILIAVALPSFLGQTSKAQDSVIEQKLALAYRAEKAASMSSTGKAWNTTGARVEAGVRPASLTVAKPGLISMAAYTFVEDHRPNVVFVCT